MVTVLPKESCAVTVAENATPLVAVPGAETANFEGVPTVLVKLNIATGAGPAVTVTVKAPGLPFAVNVPAVATPLPLVFTVMVLVLLEKVPDWPLPPVLAVKVTGVFGIIDPPWSFTVTARGVPKAKPTATV